MNLSKLFPIQKKLDDRIVKEKGLEGKDLLNKKMLALLSELGELANEWRGFKFWSEDQEPRTEISYAICNKCGGTGTPIGIPDYAGVDCWECKGSGELIKNPLLEEYVDCLHFMLSILLSTDTEKDSFDDMDWLFERENTCTNDEITESFITINSLVTSYYFELKSLRGEIPRIGEGEHTEYYPNEAMMELLDLGGKLGFTWEEVEQAYYAKNKVNHERQENGY